MKKLVLELSDDYFSKLQKGICVKYRDQIYNPKFDPQSVTAEEGEDLTKKVVEEKQKALIDNPESKREYMIRIIKRDYLDLIVRSALSKESKNDVDKLMEKL